MLSQTLKRLRENSGYTQQQVANALNLERSTYTYYETGKTTPDINTIIKLSKIFNVSYTEIFENEEKDAQKSVRDLDDDLYYRYDSQNYNHIYELSKGEKTLISLYRVLPVDIQHDIIGQLKEKVDDLSERQKNK